MLGTAEQDKTRQLAARVEQLGDALIRVGEAVDSVIYAAPEVRESCIHSLINVCRQVTK